MPNWCNNTVEISHEDVAKMEALVAAVNEGKFCNHVVPVPKALTETVAGHCGDGYEQELNQFKMELNQKYFGATDWYGFCTSNWGTKWDVDVEIDDASSISEQVIFSFESAWAPPQKAIAILAEKFNKLSFRHSYLEEGVGFVGYDEYDTGGLTNSEYNEDSKSDEWKQLAQDEFGWEPWPDDDAELEQVEVTEVVKPAKKPAKKKVKKTAVKKTSKKTTKKVAKKKKK